MTVTGKDILGLASQERGSRSLGISVDSRNPHCVYTVDRRSRSASVLCVTFEEATLTQCDFHRVLHDYVHLHTNCCCQILQHTCSYLRNIDNFAWIQIWISGIHFDLDWRSCVASSTVFSGRDNSWCNVDLEKNGWCFMVGKKFFSQTSL